LAPLNSQRLDQLIPALRDSLSTTIVVVSHELASIFAIADDAIFLDTKRHMAVAHGDPRKLRESSDGTKVRAFISQEAVDPA
jgi:phospholipid/cholesterol/gamma-HCH transport system ATP-binding protein